MITRRSFLQSGVSAAALGAGAGAARAENAPGVTDSEIKIGQTIPYSGPLSAYGVIGRTDAAYFKMINDAGGVNGRKINLISLDDAYSPPKTVEQTRRLVEGDEVALIFGSIGTPTNAAIRQYLNDNKVPQLFLESGASLFSDPKAFPWTMGYLPAYQTEAHIYAKHILATKPDAKIAVLYANNDFGKDYIVGLKAGLGASHAGMVVKEATYETSEPTVDSQVIALQASGADVLLIAAVAKFAAQAIRKSSDLGWNAARYLCFPAQSLAAVLKPAGLDKAKGLISVGFVIDVNDPRFRDDPGLKQWKDFTAKYMSATEFVDANAARAFGEAATMVQVLKQCGGDLSRANIMRQAANLKGFHPPMVFPGIAIDTSSDNFRPIRRLQLVSFNGESWEPSGGMLSG